MGVYKSSNKFISKLKEMLSRISNIAEPESIYADHQENSIPVEKTVEKIYPIELAEPQKYGSLDERINQCKKRADKSNAEKEETRQIFNEFQRNKSTSYLNR